MNLNRTSNVIGDKTKVWFPTIHHRQHSHKICELYMPSVYIRPHSPDEGQKCVIFYIRQDVVCEHPFSFAVLRLCYSIQRDTVKKKHILHVYLRWKAQSLKLVSKWSVFFFFFTGSVKIYTSLSLSLSRTYRSLQYFLHFKFIR